VLTLDQAGPRHSQSSGKAKGRTCDVENHAPDVCDSRIYSSVKFDGGTRHLMWALTVLDLRSFGSAFRRHGKRLRVLPVLEKGEVRAGALRRSECGASGRWHIHCAIELPSHFDAITLESITRKCWAKVEWGHGRILVRDGANAGWIDNSDRRYRRRI
jgi:hypothetical protein